jgi:hypothetical protein
VNSIVVNSTVKVNSGIPYMHRNSGYRVIITVEPSLFAAQYQLAGQSGTSGGVDVYKADVLGGAIEYKVDVLGGAEECKVDVLGGANKYKVDVLGGEDEYKADVSEGADEYKADASGRADAPGGVDEDKADGSGLSPAHNAGWSAAADQPSTISELLSELMLSIDVTVLCRGETPSYTRSQLYRCSTTARLTFS